MTAKHAKHAKWIWLPALADSQCTHSLVPWLLHEATEISLDGPFMIDAGERGHGCLEPEKDDFVAA